jgi:CxxC-x17-CxxC domain-containing protein
LLKYGPGVPAFGSAGEGARRATEPRLSEVVPTTNDGQSVLCPWCAKPIWTQLERATVRNPNEPPPAARANDPHPPSRVASFYGGKCRQCGEDVYVPWKPKFDGGLLCGLCYQNAGVNPQGA